LGCDTAKVGQPRSTLRSQIRTAASPR
jgi:hypothetical protein